MPASLLIVRVGHASRSEEGGERRGGACEERGVEGEAVGNDWKNPGGPQGYWEYA